MSTRLLPLSIRLHIGVACCAGILHGCQPAGTTDPQPDPAMMPKATQSTMLTISNRQVVAEAYNQEFANAPLINWSGNTGACNEGSSATAYVAAQLSRINYYRAMAGVEGKVTFVDSLSRKAQKTALMMHEANTLSHYPTENWKCYSQDGKQTAAHANLALNYGPNPDFVTQYMDDQGINNAAVGHRRWLMAPEVAVMGTGNVQLKTSGLASNTLFIGFGAYSVSRQATRDEFLCWPVAGYMPYKLVFKRWSFHLPDADFSDATVRVSKAGKLLPVTIVSDDDEGFGDNAVIWEMDAVSKPSSDQVYEVSIQNVRKGAQVRAFAYKVTVIDPATK